MPYAVLLKEAHALVDEIPEEKIESVVVYLKSFGESGGRERNVSEMKSLFGILPSDCTIEEAKSARLLK